jgi:aminoglycoside phosphotransferase (APT) family kinase protein
VTSVGWLEDPTEASLRTALSVAVPRLAGLPLRINPALMSSNPLWWSSTAVIDEAFVVKFAWSEQRALRLWREGVILQRLRTMVPPLAIPHVVALSAQPALVVTRMVAGAPLDGDWVWDLSGARAERIGRQLALFLVDLHGASADDVLRGLVAVEPTPQAGTTLLRRRFPKLVDEQRSSSVLRWCTWVDEVLGDRSTAPEDVLVHGDLHSYNQLWDPTASALVAVLDFEESGLRDPHFDFRYLPGTVSSTDLLIATMQSYQQLCGRRLSIERVMAWNVLTVLGDALWRTEAGVALPGGGDAASWVDDLKRRLDTLALP